MGICYNRLAEAVLTSTHNLCFEQKYEKYQFFYLKMFSFFGGEISKNLNRRVFVIISIYSFQVYRAENFLIVPGIKSS